MILHGFEKQKKPNKFEARLKVRNDVEVVVESIRVVRFPLETDFVLILENTFYVPTLRRNLILVHVLDKTVFCCMLHNGVMGLLLMVLNHWALSPLHQREFSHMTSLPRCGIYI